MLITILYTTTGAEVNIYPWIEGPGTRVEAGSSGHGLLGQRFWVGSGHGSKRLDSVQSLPGTP